MVGNKNLHTYQLWHGATGHEDAYMDFCIFSEFEEDAVAYINNYAKLEQAHDRYADTNGVLRNHWWWESYWVKKVPYHDGTYNVVVL